MFDPLFDQFVFEQVVKNCLSPEWQMFSIRMNTLCGGDLTRPIQVGTDGNNVKLHNYL